MEELTTFHPRIAEVIVKEEYNPYPDILSFTESGNIFLHSPNADYDIAFAMTKETLMDIDIFRSFIQNAVSRFRHSREYKAYKAYLMELGLCNSAIHGNISSDMATIEMHHCILNIFDIALMITQHVINTVGVITTFDLVQLLILEHRNNNVPVVMLDETTHQMYHSDIDSYIPPNMVFGKWPTLLYNYSKGITIDIAKKIIYYIQKYYNDKEPMIVELREQIISFANYNEYGYHYANSTMAIPTTGYYMGENQ